MARGLWLLCVGVLVPAGARAADAEVRTYAVSVDGRRAGQSVLAIDRKDDGAVTVTANVSISLRFFIKTYTYTYQGTEVWKAGRLQALQSTSNDDGKSYRVTAATGPNGLNVTVNGQARVTRADVWTTSYWQLHDAKLANRPVPLLDADTGRDLNGYLQHLGASPLSVAGQTVPCTRYRVTGGPSPVDVWFDAANRLVRQEFVEDGHRTIVELISTQRR
jgi:hypothetical protein